MSNVTYKIDRLSNYKVQLGLKSGLTLESQANGSDGYKLYLNSPVFVPEGTSVSANGQLATKKYVDDTIQTSGSALIAGWLQAGEGITLTSHLTGSVQDHTIFSLQDKYGGDKDFSEGTKVISSITSDRYGRIISATYKQLSTADLTNDNTYDNYRSWTIGVGTSYYDVYSSYGTDGKGTDKSSNALFITGANGVVPTLTNTGTSNTLNVSLNFATAGAIESGTSGIDLKSISALGTGLASGLYSITVDKYGRITAGADFTSANMVTKYGYFSGSSGLLVAPNDATHQTTSAVDETPDKDKRYLNSDGNWSKIPYYDVSVQAKTDNAYYSILGTSATSDSTASGVSFSGGSISVKFNPSTGNIEAKSFTGDGSTLTTLNASNITTGTLGLDRLPANIKNLNSLGSSISGYPINSVLYVSAAGSLSAASENTSTNSANFVLAKVSATSTANVAPEWVDITAITKTQIDTALTSALIFKGFLAKAEGTATLTELPSSFKTGWMYKVSEAGTYGYGAFKCEINDTIYCIKDSETGVTMSSTNVGDYWSVLQANIDGAVIFDPSKSADAGTTYKVPIKVSGASSYTIFESPMTFKDGVLTAVASQAQSLFTSRTLWGKSFNGTGDVSGDITGTGDIMPSATATSSIGSSGLKYSNVWATTFNGNLSGNADTATKLGHSLTVKGITGSAADVVFTGETVKTVTLDYANYKLLTASSTSSLIAAKSGSGNVITGISATIDSTSGNVVITPKYDSVAVISASGLFSFAKDASTGALTASWFSSKQTGMTFYSGSTTNPVLSEKSSRLNLNGSLYSSEFYQVLDHGSGGMARVAQTQNTAATAVDAAPILTSYALTSNSAYYEFIKSGFTIKTTLTDANWNDGTMVPVANAVKTYVLSKTSGQTKTMRLKFSTTNKSTVSGTALPAHTLIKKVMLVCNSPVTGTSPCVSITDGSGLNLVSTNENDLLSSGVYEFAIGEALGAESSTPTMAFYDNATLASIAAADVNNVVAYIDYVEYSD